MTFFVTTGKVEQEIAVNELLYTEETAPITGFARWDALVDKEDKNDRFILVMPTWRSWLEDVSDEEFMQSDYFNRYTSLLKSPCRFLPEIARKITYISSLANILYNIFIICQEKSTSFTL